MSKIVDVDLERSLLAAAIRRPHLLADQSVIPELFGGAEHAGLAGAVLAHIEAGEDLAVLELAVRETHGRLVEEVIGAKSAAHYTMAPGFARGLGRLRRLAASRMLLERVDRARAALVDVELEAASEILGDVLDGVDFAGLPLRTFGQAASTHVRKMLAEEESGADAAGDRAHLRTGLTAIDQAVRGLRKGSLWLVGGRSGCRKSNVILRSATRSLRDGRSPAIISIEDPEEVWGERLIALEAADRDLGVGPDSLMAAAETASQLRGRIVYPLDGKPAAVLDSVRRVVAEGATDVYVDYVQAIQFPDTVRRLDKATANFARALRGICRRTGAVAVLGSQLTTDRDKAHKEPTPYDLRESRELMDAADVITLHWKPDPTHDEVVLGRVAKVKWGPGGQPYQLVVAPQGMVVDAEPGHPAAREFSDEDLGPPRQRPALSFGGAR